MILPLQVSQVPFLGPWGQLLLVIFAAFLAYLTWRQRQWRSTAEAAAAALDILKDELETWKNRGERLGKENRDLLQDNATLLARTDLKPIVDMITAWTVESRGHFLKAMERLEGVHQEQTVAMVKVAENLTHLAERVIKLDGHDDKR